MQVQALVDTVRDFLQDADKTRYSDASLIRALNLAILDVRRLRPDYFIGMYYTETPVYSSVTDQLLVPDQLFPALVKYVTGLAEMRDDEYTADGRASVFLKAFSTDLGI